ncbi:FAD binding domain-containing protein [Leptodontidium sp. 2 PMI_412]|nr:FAD binding domain-containing protein [Leptodontidium sp. 2 PMI_412]
MSTTTATPRAHITNMATLGVGSYSPYIEDYLANEKKNAKYLAASPCAPIDLAQTLFEPILNRRAVTSGFLCRFNTEFISFKEDEVNRLVNVLVQDNIFGTQYTVQCKYLFGADGARSKILRQLDLPLKVGEGAGVEVWNVLMKADLSRLMQFRGGNLHWTFQEDHLNSGLVWVVHPRMVSPWDVWVVGFFVAPGSSPKSDIPSTHSDWAARITKFIGDESIPVELLDISRWQLNNSVAQQYSGGRVFCLGYAVHRHTPGGGLGSNTSVQDVYNLAWKVAYVLKGKPILCDCVFVQPFDLSLKQEKLIRSFWSPTRLKGSQ